MECGKGYRPSYAWRSILFGRELLKEGMIGNGADSYVWSDKWIMDVMPRPPINKERNIEVTRKVESLFSNEGQWDTNVLTQLFPPNDVRRIQTLMPGSSADRNIWAFTDHGSYTVKSAYWLRANRESSRVSARSTAEQASVALKKKVWKIPTLPKIRVFMWRALSGALVVADRLNSRGLNVDQTCKLCNNVLESINHVLFQCHPAQELLQTVHFPVDSMPPSNLTDNFTMILQMISDTIIEESRRNAIPWLLWTIWKNCNSIRRDSNIG